MRIGGREVVGRITLDPRDRGGVHWQADASPITPFDLGPATLSIGPPAAILRVTGYVQVSSSFGRGRLLPVEVGEASALLDHAIIHWLNVPNLAPLNAEILRQGGATWAGRRTLKGGGWEMTFDARSDLADALRAVDDRDALVTHTGLLRRTDGGTFTPAEANKALDGWQTLMSFALGRWVAPSLPVGFDAQGARVWESWSSRRCDGRAGHRGWWDTHDAAGLEDLAETFLAAWIDSAEKDVVWHASHHLLAANEPSMTLEARIMLVQATLEYMSWVHMVLGGRQSKTQYGKQHADDHLRLLLDASGIPSDIPPDLPSLKRYAAEEGLSDGPSAIVRLRNRLVHPKDAGEPYRINRLVTDAWILSMQYGQLLLLARLGYNGKYLPWLPLDRWAHDSVRVPWATP